MNKDLPSVFAGKIDENINNVQDVFYGSRKPEDGKQSNLSITSKINRIFNSPNYIYKKEVLITTENGSEKKVIIGKTNNGLLTINNEIIDIEDIKDITII